MDSEVIIERVEAETRRRAVANTKGREQKREDERTHTRLTRCSPLVPLDTCECPTSKSESVETVVGMCASSLRRANKKVEKQVLAKHKRRRIEYRTLRGALMPRGVA
jgi:hypothetical protein